jgi:hypothetical protein
MLILEIGQIRKVDWSIQVENKGFLNSGTIFEVTSINKSYCGVKDERGLEFYVLTEHVRLFSGILTPLEKILRGG